MDKYIVGLGEILWDVLPTGKVLGGAPANFAYHVSQFGLNGIAVSAIGKDAYGDEILSVLKDKNLKSNIEIVDFPTGTVQVTLDNKGIPQYEICEDVAWDNIPYTEQLRNIATNAKAVCFGSLAQRNKVSESTILKFLKDVPADALKIFDINLRQHFYNVDLIQHSLNLCNILKINDEEIEIVRELLDWKADTDDNLCKKLISSYNLQMVVLTKGTEGSWVVTSDKKSFKPTPLVTVADTVGAGDSFTGTFVACLLNGKTIPDSHALAVDVSAFVCTQKGAMPQLPQSYIDRIK